MRRTHPAGLEAEPTPADRRLTAPVGLERGRNIIERIGGTPLLDLSELLADANPGVRLLGKAEFCNPGGSVKDRPALFMITEALERGRLDGGRRILDATSGNTGIAYAMLGAALGIGVTLCLPRNASPERRRLLRAYGAEIVDTDPLEGSDGAIRRARELCRDTSRYLYLDQYSNPQNWRSHYETTGPEIWTQTNGQITHFVTGLGTSGTFVGIARALDQLSDGQVVAISAQPDGPLHGLEGMKHMSSALVPSIYDPSLAERELTVSTERAYRMVRRLARDHGLAVGISAGANVAVALDVARELATGIVVTILCDDAMKYLSDSFWEGEDDSW